MATAAESKLDRVALALDRNTKISEKTSKSLDLLVKRFNEFLDIVTSGRRDDDLERKNNNRLNRGILSGKDDYDPNLVREAGKNNQLISIAILGIAATLIGAKNLFVATVLPILVSIASWANPEKYRKVEENVKGFYLMMYNISEWIRKTTLAFETRSKAAVKALEATSDSIKNTIQKFNFPSFIKNILNALSGKFTPFMRDVGILMNSLLRALNLQAHVYLKNLHPTNILKVFGLLTDFFRNMFNIILLWDGFAMAFHRWSQSKGKQWYDRALIFAGGFLEGTWNSMAKALTGFMNIILNNIPNVLKGVHDGMKWLLNKTGLSFFTNQLEFLKDYEKWVTWFFNQAKTDEYKKKVEYILDIYRTIFDLNWIKSAYSALSKYVTSSWSSWMSSIYSLTQQTISSTMKFIEDIYNSILKFLGSVVSKVKEFFSGKEKEKPSEVKGSTESKGSRDSKDLERKQEEKKRSEVKANVTVIAPTTNTQKNTNVSSTALMMPIASPRNIWDPALRPSY